MINITELAVGDLPEVQLLLEIGSKVHKIRSGDSFIEAGSNYRLFNYKLELVGGHCPGGQLLA